MKRKLLFVISLITLFISTALAQNTYVLDLSAKHYFHVEDNASNDLDVTGDFTIEAWVNCTDFTGRLCDRAGVMRIYATSSSIRFDLDGGGSISTGTVTTDEWHHIAVCRSGSATRIFLDGVEKASADLAPVASDAPFYVGGQDTWFGAWTSKIDEFRFSNVARYTSDFTPTVHDPEFISDDNTILLYHFDNNTEFPPSNSSGKSFTQVNHDVAGTDYVEDSSLPFDGTLAINDNPDKIVDSYQLLQNYPNPFNPTTSIPFVLTNPANIILSIYDMTGKLVGEIANGWYSAGKYVVSFNATNLSSGVYLYRLQAGNISAIRKMMLVK